MDINKFYLDYEILFEVLTLIVIFAFFIERALAVIFESERFIKMYESGTKRKGLKELLTVIVSIATCMYWRLDAFSVISAAHANMTIPGYLLTGMVVAGGSKAAMKLFKDMMGIMSSSEEKRLAAKKKKK